MKLLARVFKNHPLSLIIGIGACACLIGLNELAYRDSTTALQEQDRVSLIQQNTVELTNALKSAESSQLGYLLSGNENFHSQYLTEANRARMQLDILADLEKSGDKNNSAIQSDYQQKLQGLVSNYLAQMQDLVEQKKAGKLQFDLTRSTAGSELSRLETNALLQDLQTRRLENRQSVQAQLQRVRDALQLSRLGVIFMGLAALVAFLLFMRQREQLHIHNELIAQHSQMLEVERNRLEQQVKVRTASLRELATNLQTTSEETRSRLARELHDELGSLLTATKLHVARIKSKLPPDDEAAQHQLQSLNQTLNQVIAIKRRIIEDLRPSALSNFGLNVALDILQSEFQERTGIAIETHLETVDLDPPSQLAIYRIVQESLNNVAKYADATAITIEMTSRPDRIELRIEDNGVGFDQNVIKPKSHGLAGMRHRVESLRGTLQVTSAPGKGTRIVACIPQMSSETLQAPYEEEAL